MAMREENELADTLIENAREDCVLTIDGFGRKLGLLHACRTRSAAEGRVCYSRFWKLHEGVFYTCSELVYSRK